MRRGCRVLLLTLLGSFPCLGEEDPAALFKSFLEAHAGLTEIGERQWAAIGPIRQEQATNSGLLAMAKSAPVSPETAAETQGHLDKAKARLERAIDKELTRTISRAREHLSEWQLTLALQTETDPAVREANIKKYHRGAGDRDAETGGSQSTLSQRNR